ncbi:hypothetical protein PCH_Pc13g12790 [Penicillium rubens Wisconsin 54-1255]|uniref:Uncharacterized protein n=1 Tax=Penicillium rubens (strain ATCC 28089 / DSM 1075 / NRRL 1951 / Wisconsin 54-1255) TaxID=500485 RepID=B6H362_PENRW|nr:hypothetical protein PCH_Pc13g12790 [Penicillium rubens Wisconsin 54-1255]
MSAARSRTLMGREQICRTANTPYMSSVLRTRLVNELTAPYSRCPYMAYQSTRKAKFTNAGAGMRIRVGAVGVSGHLKIQPIWLKREVVAGSQGEYLGTREIYLGYGEHAAKTPPMIQGDRAIDERQDGYINREGWGD